MFHLKTLAILLFKEVSDCVYGYPDARNGRIWRGENDKFRLVNAKRKHKTEPVLRGDKGKEKLPCCSSNSVH